MSSPKTITIFGSTGGTGLTVLKNSLAAGYTVNVLARTPAKLEALAKEYPTTLQITEGDIRDITTVKKSLINNNKISDIVVSAIGMVFSMQGLKIGPMDTTVCTDGVKVITSALSALESENIQGPLGGPRIVLLSSTGISDKGRDIPLLIVPFYHILLAAPHRDKKNMEDIMVKGEGNSRRWVIIRPSFFSGGRYGMKTLRVGTETPGSEEKEVPVIGYTTNREDVGDWIFEECVKGDGTKWERKMVSLTH